MHKRPNISRNCYSEYPWRYSVLAGSLNILCDCCTRFEQIFWPSSDRTTHMYPWGIQEMVVLREVLMDDGDASLICLIEFLAALAVALLTAALVLAGITGRSRRGTFCCSSPPP